MTLNDLRNQHEAAWQRLSGIVSQRTDLLKQLGQMANYAGDFSPATGMFMEFDIDKARDLLARLEDMTPVIYYAIDELNSYAKQIGKPRIERRKL